MPKVAHFIDSHDPGGAETVIVEICRRVEAYGYMPEVYHFGNPWLEEKCREYDIPALFVPGHRWFTSASTLPLFILNFVRFLRKQRVDILHSHLFGAVTGASFAAYLARIPHMGTVHDIYTIEEKKERIRYIRVASFLGTRLVTVSHQMKQYLSSLGKFRNGALQTIVNGVDLDKFSLSVNRNAYPELDLNPGDIVLVCVGRLEEIKGHDILLTALAKIESKNQVKLLIVGDGPRRNEIERQIDKENLQNNVRLLGHREDVPALLNLSDCFVLSSRSEGLSCSIIEAMAAGLSIVASDVGGNSELVANGVNGYLVPPDNPEVLSMRLQSVINDAARRRKFGQMSLKRVRDYYSIDIMINKYVDNYDEMIAKSTRPSQFRFRKN
jgi:glycosyltransferase involved in cell wall biosynthesis